MPESTHDEAIVGSVPVSKLSDQQIQSLGRALRAMVDSPYVDPVDGEIRGELKKPEGLYRKFVRFMNEDVSSFIFRGGTEHPLKIEYGSPLPQDIPTMAEYPFPTLDGGMIYDYPSSGPEMYERDEDNATYTKHDLRPGLRHGYIGRSHRHDSAERSLSRVDRTLSKAGNTAEKFVSQLLTKTEAENYGIAVTKQGELAANQLTDAVAGVGDQMLAAIPLQEKWTLGQEALVARQKEWLAGLSHSLNARGSASPTHLSSTRPSRGSGRMEDDPLAHDPRYNPGEGESWGHYYQVAFNLAKNGRTERERKLGRERAVRAAQILGIPVPTFAGGTPFAPGGLALVGEMGPELVNLPRGSQVIPNPRLGGDVHVHVNVEGSVVAERDLAQRLRQELIRTSRRTVDLGFN